MGPHYGGAARAGSFFDHGKIPVRVRPAYRDAEIAAGAALCIPQGPGLRFKGQPGGLHPVWGQQQDLIQGFLLI